MNFYVIENSDDMSDSITMLKAEPLTVDEVNTYGVGHINRYTQDLAGTVSNNNGYGGMTYYSSETCGYPAGASSSVTTGCTTDYAQSEVKYAVDAWAKDKFQASDLKEDSLGYKARLITLEELQNNLGYAQLQSGDTFISYDSSNSPSWIYNSNYLYWTMSPYEYFALNVWCVYGDGFLYHNFVGNGRLGVVRPVVTLLKSAI